jgi:hypothetical protein
LIKGNGFIVVSGRIYVFTWFGKKGVDLRAWYVSGSGPHSRGAPGVFYAYFYNHARRLRLEKLLYLGLSRSSNGFLKPLLDPGGGFTSESAAQRFHK